MLRTLKSKIVYMAIGLGIIVSLCVSAFSYHLMKTFMLKNEENKLLFSAKLVARSLRHEIRGKEMILEVISGSKEMDIYHKKRQMSELAYYFARFSHEFPVLCLFDYDGAEQFRVVEGGITDKSEDMSRDPLFKSAVTSPGKVINSIMIDPDKGAIIRFAFAVQTYFDEPVGVIIGEVPVPKLSASVLSIDNMEISEHVFPVVLGQGGEILYHPDRSMVAEKLYYAGNDAEKLVSSAVSMDAGFGRAVLFGEDNYIAYAPVEGVDWSLMLVLPYKEFIAIPNKLRDYTLIFSVILMLVVAVFSSRFAKQISKSIGRLSDLVAHIARGDLTKRAQVDSMDELGDLGKSLNTMSEALRVSREEIESSKASLHNLSKHILSVREEERRNISYMVHDELSQAIATLKVNMAWLRRRLPEGHEELSGKVNELSGMLDEMSEMTHQIIYSLRPIVLDELGLGPAISWQKEQFERNTGIECEVEVDPEIDSIGRPTSDVLFRVCQEALTNVARHSRATRVDISLNRLNGSVQLLVRDNGRGINESEVNASTSYGLMGMRERVDSLRGEFIVCGKSGEGTTVMANIPTESDEGRTS